MPPARRPRRRRCTPVHSVRTHGARAGSSRNACKSHSHTKFIIFPLIFPPSVPTVYMVVSSMARTRDCTSFAFYTLLYSNRILLSPFFPPNSSCCTNEHCSQIISPLTSYRRTIIPPPTLVPTIFAFAESKPPPPPPPLSSTSPFPPLSSRTKSDFGTIGSTSPFSPLVHPGREWRRRDVGPPPPPP